jgi:N-acetylmuramoyl-L-alanine amidase-like protein
MVTLPGGRRGVVVVLLTLAAVALGAAVPALGGARAHGRAATAARSPVGAPRRPVIVARFIPFDSRRKAEMLAYARRHYGLGTYRLVDPHVIVEHFTATSTFAQTYNTFAPDVPDSELHELPGTCAHFVVDTDGTIYQLVSVTIMCRHTVGLNWTALGIEMVGTSDAQILHRPRQIDAALALTRWLRCHFNIQLRNVIGHNESLSSPYHRERVAALRHQTHEDWVHADMQIFRTRLAALGGCG